MRIRKRKVPLPLSLLSPVPLSDPHLFRHSLLHHPHPSDPPPATSASDLRTSTVEEEESCLVFQTTRGERISPKSYNDNDARKEETMVTGTDTAVLINNNAVANEVGVARWSEGERVMPLKKRRSSGMSFEFDNMDEDRDYGEEKKKVIEVNNSNSNSNSSKQKRGTTIMEGSRCSRVNGRGWRCCQPTLVGYSLCEHHLGKGRLRSMSATVVRGARPSPSSSKKKKQVVGVVKARSLSSLLGQTANTTTTDTTINTVTTNNNNNTANHEITSIEFHENT